MDGAVLSAMEAAVASCEEAYQRNSRDSFYSNIYRAQIGALKRLTREYQQWQGDPGELLAKWEQELAQENEDLAREEEHPSFDWYDDHYYCKRSMGRVDAYEEMISLLRGE